MPAKLEISLKNLEYNINNFKKYVNDNSDNTNVEILAMVKADAYGAGMIEVSKRLEKLGINYLGVAYLKEAKILRGNSIKSNIIVFSGILKEEADEATDIDAIYAISNIKIAKLLNEKAKEKNKIVKINLAIDTGMGRLGARENNINETIKEIKKLDNLEVDGVFSHFSSADSDKVYTESQINKFNKALEILKKEGIKYSYAHICNSIGICNSKSSYNNMVRLGIGLYGYLECAGIKQKGIFKLSAPISDIRWIEKGEPVGYSKTYITDKKTKVATLQIGYADGLNRLLSNKYELNINGKKARIIGNICMDMTMIDVTDVDNINVGDYVNIFDFEDNKVNEIANICNTINYEVISTVGKRVDRCYV